tara:strand:- start:413 stop:1690 length:1278 start_codon:yes stop_codon:yes gene_type:complete
LNHLKDIAEQNRNGVPIGIYSVCSAHPLVIEAAIEQALEDGTPLLIEATANQVNQFGGYTGMRASDFNKFVTDIAQKLNYPANNIILGGDHLGPVCWQEEKSTDAMDKADDLIREYVAAGFKKIHLDCSMGCSDDDTPLSDEIVASRAARLCKVAEEEAHVCFGSSDILYIIGTEVPPPGGTNEEILELEVTDPEHAALTLREHKKAFYEEGLSEAWQRVIGLVVQPGVEFSHTSIVQYDPKKSFHLKSFISLVDNIIFEAHSTDYQAPENYKSLVRDHFAILKVGPQLTFAMREALYALSYVEEHLFDTENCSNLCEVCEAEMLAAPKSWQRFYPGTEVEQHFFRHFSYSDRIRYYWPNTKVTSAVNKLIENLQAREIPLPLISQFLPEQYPLILSGKINNNPSELIKAKIKTVLQSYSKACTN